MGSHAPSDAEIVKQMESIAEDNKKLPLVGDLEDISTLMDEYSGATATQLAKVKYLTENYSKIRRIRRDGNCFIRAFEFGMFHYLLDKKNSEVINNTISYFRSTFEQLVSEGFSEYIEDFWEVLIEELEEVQKVAQSDKSEDEKIEFVHSKINDQSISDYIVCYLRFIISAYLKRNADEYQCFITENITVAEFCIRDVEPMAIECDHLQITGLTNSVSEVLQGSIFIEYLDNSELKIPNHVQFPEGHLPFLYLLYRPGHYDILYK